MKFGVREICDVVLKAKSAVKIGSHTFKAGEPVIYFDTAKTSTMESAATTVYAMGGRGNTRLIAWEGEKTLTFTMEDALLSPQGLAILSGADLIQANGKEKIIAHVTETVVATEDGKLTVSKTPAAGTNIYVMLLDSNGEMSGVPMKVTAISTDLDVTGYIHEGEAALVDYYCEHLTDAMQIDITPDKFAGYYYLEASTLFRRQSDGVDLPAEFIIPKVKIQSNFTFSMASSGDPSSFTFTMDAFPDYIVGNKTKKVLASIQILSADDNCDLTSDSVDGEVVYERYKYNEDGCSYLTTEAEGPITPDDIKEFPRSGGLIPGEKPASFYADFDKKVFTINSVDNAPVEDFESVVKPAIEGLLTAAGYNTINWSGETSVTANSLSGIPTTFTIQKDNYFTVTVDSTIKEYVKAGDSTILKCNEISGIGTAYKMKDEYHSYAEAQATAVATNVQETISIETGYVKLETSYSGFDSSWTSTSCDVPNGYTKAADLNNVIITLTAGDGVIVYDTGSGSTTGHDATITVNKPNGSVVFSNDGFVVTEDYFLTTSVNTVIDFNASNTDQLVNNGDTITITIPIEDTSNDISMTVTFAPAVQTTE